MRPIRSLLLLSLVAALTAGVAYWRWAELAQAMESGGPLLQAAWPVLATALGGLLAVHLHAVIRLARLARADAGRTEPRPKASRSVRPRAKEKKADASGPRPEAAARSSASTRPDEPPAVPAGKKPTPSSEEPEKVEEFLRVVLEDADAEEISFLPPYASDEAETEEEIAYLDPHGEEPEDELGVVGPGPATAGLAPGNGPEDEAEEGIGALAPEPADAPAEEPERYRNVPIPRHFALGTVAIIKEALTPAEVAQVLVEQRKRPRERFGELAVEMELLSRPELQELLVAQQEGLFTDEEIREARRRIKAFRELEAAASSS